MRVSGRGGEAVGIEAGAGDRGVLWLLRALVPLVEQREGRLPDEPRQTDRGRAPVAEHDEPAAREADLLERGGVGVAVGRGPARMAGESEIGADHQEPGVAVEPPLQGRGVGLPEALEQVDEGKGEPRLSAQDMRGAIGEGVGRQDRVGHECLRLSGPP